MKDLRRCRGKTSGSVINEKELQIQRYESRELRIQIHCGQKEMRLERCLKG